MNSRKQKLNYRFCECYSYRNSLRSQRHRRAGASPQGRPQETEDGGRSAEEAAEETQQGETQGTRGQSQETA